MAPLELARVHKASPLLKDIMRLYESAFPKNERRPLEVLLTEHGPGDVLAVLEGGAFIGLAILLTHLDITHILYLAVEDRLRGRGYGSRILTLIRAAYPGQRIVVDVEEPGAETANGAQRQRRIDFYERNGYRCTDIRYRWRGEAYLIMSNGGDVSEREFDAFWDYFYEEQTGYNF